MNILNKYCQEVIVVSLRESQERRLVLSKELKKMGIDFHFHDALNGKEEGEKYLKNQLNRQNFKGDIKQKEMSLGELGCLMSHKMIWQKVVNERIPNVLVLEDDIVSNYNMDQIQDIFNKVPEKARLIYLGFRGFIKEPISFQLKKRTIYPLKAIRNNNFNGYTLKELKKLYSKPYNDSFMTAGAHHGTHSYILSFEGAKQLLAFSNDNFDRADLLLGKFAINSPFCYRTKEELFSPSTTFHSTIVEGTRNRT